MTDRDYKIAVLPGDGIGPEVMAQAHKVLDAIEQNTAFVSVVKSTMLVVLRLITTVVHCQKALCVL